MRTASSYSNDPYIISLSLYLHFPLPRPRRRRRRPEFLRAEINCARRENSNLSNPTLIPFVAKLERWQKFANSESERGSPSLARALAHLNHWQHVADEGAEDPVLHDEDEDGEGHDDAQLQQERRAQVQHAGQRVLLLLLDGRGRRREWCLMRLLRHELTRRVDFSNKHSAFCS